MLPWVERPTIDLDLAKPPARRFDDVPPEALTLGRLLLDAVRKEIPPIARVLAYWVRLRTGNRFHKEAVALARRAGVDWRDVVVANISYDLLLLALGCSTVALPTPDGPVLARNMDWWPEDILAQASYRIRVFREGAFQFAIAGWPGSMGVVTGLSARGFAVVLNAVIGPEKVRKTGYPVLLHVRRVVEDARDFDGALAMLSRQTLAAPALFTLVGTTNEQRVVIERTPRRHALRWPHGNEPLVATNDYRLLFQPEARPDHPELYQTSCTRYDALCEFFSGHRADRQVQDAALLYILSDSKVIQDITAQHVIIRPRLQEFRVFVPRRLLPEQTQAACSGTPATAASP